MLKLHSYPAIFSFVFILSACTNSDPSRDSPEPVVALEDGVESGDWLNATYKAPQDWTEEKLPHLIKYTAPEGDGVIAIIVIEQAEDSAQAAMRAWQVLSPGFAREVRFNNDEVATNGWQQQTFIEYESTVSEERSFYAKVLRDDTDWNVILVDASLSTLSKRRSQLNTLEQSYTVVGYENEDFSTAKAQKLDAKKIESLLSFVRESAEKLKVPGVGIAVMQDGEILYEGGVGVKDIDTGEPVGKDTLFAVASNTKGMTTLLLAKLVEMGKLDWDDKVTDHYPDFRLGSTETTDNLRIRHLVCACTGLPRKDMTWIFNSGPDAPALMALEDLANVEPTSEFGELYQYNNQMPAVAGYIAGHILYPDMDLDKAYDKAMQEYIFNPLKMHNTTFSFANALAGNIAKPYALDNDFKPIELVQTANQGFNLTVIPYRPSGGAFSSSSDMLKYVANELSAGVSSNGKRLYAEAPLLERRVPSVSSGEDSYYGMGLSTKKIAGVEVIEHGGSLAGYLSQFIVIPGADVGAVILTNSDEGYYLLSAFQNKLIELLYDATPKAQDEIEVFAQEQRKIYESRISEIDLPGDASVLANLAPRYENEILGDATISVIDDETIFDPGVWKSALTTKTSNDGSRSIVLLNPVMFGMELVVGQDEKGKRTLKLIDSQHSYVFTEVGAQ
ncbi:serine hydrolase domain-containing protein [Aliiglaciecola lipolytica]|uniref:Beta-lactamase class C family protein n=1 Tax=Aliiglaciecola lipolytica E3 TaxID=1127673 RepID=K6WX10_9ALTE|nr:hydrolase [Aliiglaciecola lipolytica]GAC12984.1 beta-lactamase class C family protein [Aliiglaciecola lipolytica E3]